MPSLIQVFCKVVKAGPQRNIRLGVKKNVLAPIPQGGAGGPCTVYTDRPFESLTWS